MLECKAELDLQTVVAFVNERLDALRGFCDLLVEVHIGNPQAMHFLESISC